MAGNPTVKVGFLGDASQLAREAERARKSLATVETQSHTLSTALGTAFGVVIGKGIGAVASAAKGAAFDIVGFAKDSVNAASDMNESISKSQAVFGASADAVAAWASDNTKNILLTKQTAIEASATFGNLFTALGIGAAPAAALSTKLVGLAEDLSSFNNVSVDDAIMALRSGMVGEVEPLRKFGVQLSETRMQAEAFALGIAKPMKNAAGIKAAQDSVAAAVVNLTKVQKEHGVGTLAAAQAQDKLNRANAQLTKEMGGQKANLTDAQKSQARLAIILHDTAKAQGDAQRTSGGYANSTRILQKNISDLQASIGAKLLPYVLRGTQALSKLVVEFDKGTGAGGRLRQDMSKLGGEAADIAQDLKPVLNVARWFVEHPNAFKAAGETMLIFATASKSAAFWSTRLAAKLPEVAAGEVAVAEGGAGAATGVGAVGTAAKGALAFVLPFAAAITTVVEGYKALKGGLSGKFPDAPTPYEAKHGGLYGPGLVISGDPDKGKAPTPPPAYDTSDLPDKSKLHLGGSQATVNAAAAAQQKNAAKAAQSTRDAADTTASAQQYAADKAQAAADAKAKAAEALQAATQKLSDALQTRLDTAKNIRDSLVSSNSVVRDGVSWTAKDLLSRFQLTMTKVKRFQSALQTMVREGYSQDIVQQVAAAGVQGGLGTAVALAHATATQRRQFNAAQAGINAAAARAGDAVASQLGPITFTSNLVVNDKVLATAVNRWNARNGYNGGRLAS